MKRRNRTTKRKRYYRENDKLVKTGKIQLGKTAPGVIKNVSEEINNIAQQRIQQVIR